ncbi:MAG: lipoprotein [Ramlibacter sp.]|nr:lipoprotein [Ramlibacter sp.]
MQQRSRILVMALFLACGAASLQACGQKGPLYLPDTPSAAQRATLPQTLRPGASAAPPATAASGVSRP